MEMTTAKLAGNAGTAQSLERDKERLNDGAAAEAAHHLAANDGANHPTEPAEERVKRPEGIIRHRPVATDGMAQDFMHGSHSVGGMRSALHQYFLMMGCDKA